MLAASGQSFRGSERRACVEASQSMEPAAPEASQAASCCGACGMALGLVMRQTSKPSARAFACNRALKAEPRNRDPRRSGAGKGPAAGP